MNKKEEHTCPVCKKVFCKKVYKKTQSVYCSQSCAYKGRTMGFTKRVVKNPYNCKRKKPRTCLICQQEYIYKKNTQKYCSRTCFEIAHKHNMSGKKNPAYKNGESRQSRSWRGDDWDTLRKDIYERDNYLCQDCGVRCVGKRDANKENSSHIIQCHHVEKYKINKNNDKSNLITLCLACHIKRHNPNVKTN